MAYDTMKISLVRNSNGTYALAVGLYSEGERSFYREYQRQYPSYSEACWHANQKATEYKRTMRFHHLDLAILCQTCVEAFCPQAETRQGSVLAA